MAGLRTIVMAMPRESRTYQIEGREYAVSISAGKLDEQGNVPLQISIRAHFGTRSFCTVRGVTNRSFWHDYPDIEKMRKTAISITPRHVCALIARAHSQGWNPDTSKANCELPATREDIRGLIEQDDV
ncbi:MAG: hypothetical protein KJZ78_27125 [Bryobacteraceae bacterium]|nr:hypothetical protein [Bryobacteraceae bacterium]